jgi:hypothetical protein
MPIGAGSVLPGEASAEDLAWARGAFEELVPD